MLDVSKSRPIADAQERPASQATPPQQLQIVLVFQGGGALGAYQAGVYQALHEGGIEPETAVPSFSKSLRCHTAANAHIERIRDSGGVSHASPPVRRGGAA